MNKKQRKQRKKLLKAREMINEIKSVFSIGQFFECFQLGLNYKDMLRLVRHNKGKPSRQILKNINDGMIKP